MLKCPLISTNIKFELKVEFCKHLMLRYKSQDFEAKETVCDVDPESENELSPDSHLHSLNQTNGTKHLFKQTLSK